MTGRPSTKSKYLDELLRLYNSEKWSLGEIHAELGPSIQTLSRWLREEGVELELRPRNSNAGRSAEDQARINAQISESRMGKGTGARGQRKVRTCPACKEKFTVPAVSKQVFCGTICARAVDGAAKAAEARAQYDADPKICTCDKAVPYEKRHSSKFCSEECAKRYGGRRQADPANQITYVCLNCGETASRPRSTPSSLKYCSNSCARRHTKTKQHFTVGDTTVLDSTYEVFFWGLCSMAKVSIERYDRENGVAWQEDGWYAPDFLVAWKGRSVAVETKGLEDSNDEARWAAFRAAKGIELVVLTRDQLWPPPQSRAALLELLGLS